MAGVVHIPWYATLFRGDQFEAARRADRAARAPLRRDRVRDLPVARRRATRSCSWRASRRRPQFERYWYGEEFSIWRADYQSFYQVPILYVWHDLVVRGGIGSEIPNGVTG